MRYTIILFIFLSIKSSQGFFNNVTSLMNNKTSSRLNLTCSYYGTSVRGCEYCVYQYYNNSLSLSTIYYDCIHITNTYKSLSQRCQGFSDRSDIGVGVCSPLSFETFNLSILCICATDMCNSNLTSCQSSVTNQIASNSSPSVLPSIVPQLTTPISCVETQSSQNISYYCNFDASPYINVTKCNEYVINNTVLCIYIVTENEPSLSVSLTSDDYMSFLAGTISTMNQANRDSNIVQFYNESSSYFYINWNTTNINYNITFISQRCLCAQDNCNFNLTTCLTANRSIFIGNNAIKNVNNIFVYVCLYLIIKL